MTKFESVLSQALELGEDERQLLAIRVEMSLEEAPDAGYDEAWTAEIKRRLDEIDSGEVELIDWQEVRRELTTDSRDGGSNRCRRTREAAPRLLARPVGRCR